MQSRKWFLSANSGPYASVALLCLVFCAALWTGLLLDQRNERELIIENKHLQNANLAMVFDAHVTRTMRAAELTLNDLADEHRRLRDKFDVVQYAKDHSTSVDPYNILSFVDEKGFLVSASPAMSRPVNMGHTDSYLFHSQNDSPAVFISQPRKGASTGRWTV